MIKLISGYTNYPPDELRDLGRTVATNLTGLAAFATLKPTGTDLTAAADALDNAINMTGPGRAQAIQAKFNALAEMLADVAVNAPQVPNVTDTDLAEIGLPVVKSGARATTPPAAPQNLRLRHGEMPGEVRASVDSMGHNIRGFASQWTLDPNAGPWTEGGLFPNSRAFRWVNLTRGKDTWFRVAAINAVGQGAWCDPATIMVT